MIARETPAFRENEMIADGSASPDAAAPVDRCNASLALATSPCPSKRGAALTTGFFISSRIKSR